MSGCIWAPTLDCTLAYSPRIRAISNLLFSEGTEIAVKCSTWGVVSLLGTLLISALPAWSWGNDGHRTIGMVADIILDQSPTIRDRIRQILGENSLSEVLVWADCAAFAEENPRHHLFHYTD